MLAAAYAVGLYGVRDRPCDGRASGGRLHDLVDDAGGHLRRFEPSTFRLRR